MTNPYIAYALMIYAQLDGILNELELTPVSNVNLYTADKKALEKYNRLPSSLADAKEVAKNSDFIKKHLPEAIISSYVK